MYEATSSKSKLGFLKACPYDHDRTSSAYKQVSACHEASTWSSEGLTESQQDLDTLVEVSLDGNEFK